VKQRRVEIGAVRPNGRAGLSINDYGIECGEVLERPEQLALSTGQKSIRCSLPSLNTIVTRYGPTMSNRVTR
jgi:hypothetical protein